MTRRTLVGAIGTAFCAGALVATAALRIPPPARRAVNAVLGVEGPGGRAPEPRPRVADAGRARPLGDHGRPASEARPRPAVAAEADDPSSRSKGTSGVAAGDAERVLRGRSLLLPVAGVDRRTLVDTFDAARGGGRHEALDILAPRHTPVRAVEDGRVARLFTSKRGGLTVYQFDPTGRYCYYYAHLDAYAEGLAEGQALERGEVIGYVGTTGNAPPATPHLHFAVFVLGPEKRWWEGTAIDPLPLFED